MPAVKLIVAYPTPTDIEAFEKRYVEEHVPMAVEKLGGKTKLVATKILSMADGSDAPYYRVADVHFPSMEALNACAVSQGGQETIAHAIEISSGGPPLFMVAEEEVFEF
ncbi:MAG: ethyl tert-butyl ether degradation protein EthD [Cycloclasticus sp. symbiont of Poecilosclerida sp. N]|nr:MAG: ethyl tert-butyl ether degradation protein EthD [Cycloclasticus sp. symbiont of Poecilosclerida sp. N]